MSLQREDFGASSVGRLDAFPAPAIVLLSHRPAENSIRGDEVQPMDTDDGRKLFVGGLPDVIGEDVLRQLFEATGGSVVDISLPRDRNTGRPRGFAFVTMASAEEAQVARRSLDRSSQSGRVISVREFHSESKQGPERGPRRDHPDGPGGGAGFGAGPAPRQGPPPGGADRSNDKTLYVSNLPYDAAREELESLFSGVGAPPIVRVHLPVSPEGRGRGFGFVTMDSPEAAEQAVSLMRDVGLRGRKVNVSIAHPRGERPARPMNERGPDARGDRDFAPARREPQQFDRPRSSFDEGPPEPGGEPDRFESFRGGGEDRRRKERERTEKAEKAEKKKAKGKRAAKERGGRENPSRWDRDTWDDD